MSTQKPLAKAIITDINNIVFQAVCTVSELISEGRFDDLDQLVSRDAIREVRKNYRDLTPAQRVFIRVDPRDLFFRFIYEIGMIFDDSSSKFMALRSNFLMILYNGLW